MIRSWKAFQLSIIETVTDRADFVLCWSDGICSIFRHRNLENRSKYFYCYDGLAEALVDFTNKKVYFWPLALDCSDATLDHFWVDIILPAILDHQGDLVLHAGAVIIDGLAAVFLGKSGHGKSTLTASFYGCGHIVLSDDGIIVTGNTDGAIVEAVYPGVRLLPGTLSDLFADPISTTEVAHYATKRRIVPNERMSAASFPVAALFFLSEPTNSGLISIEPMGAADACIGIVGNSFALDPSDKCRARSRIEQASRLATALPIFALDFPREISLLPQVRKVIAGTIAHARRAGGGSIAEQCT